MTEKQVWTDRLFGIDSTSKTIVWRYPNWRGYPVLRSMDSSISIVHFRGYMDTYNENLYTEFKVTIKEKIEGALSTEFIGQYANQRYMLKLADVQPTIKEVAKFKFQKLKCTCIYEWLESVHTKLQKYQFAVPGEIIGSTVEERNLLQEEYNKVKSLSLDGLNKYYSKLWHATSEADFIKLYDRLRIIYG